MLRNGLEPWHLLIVAIVVIVLFGSKKLPDTARALGRSMRILKSEAKAMKEEGEEGAESVDPAPSKPTGDLDPSASVPEPTRPPSAAR
ncbi:Sec-independent protein translocase subunit TatA [Streptomyces lincolnensis]|uniref:Sec-independent protein translocase subunit TatA n=1 Tax=Streptomyces lincolnensis TaxID=1915 RepID=UPI0037D93920